MNPSRDLCNRAPARLDHFTAEISRIRALTPWDKPEIVALFNDMIPDFDHKETGKYLDARM